MEEGHRDVVALLNRAALAKLVAGVRVTAQLPVSPPRALTPSCACSQTTSSGGARSSSVGAPEGQGASASDIAEVVMPPVVR